MLVFLLFIFMLAILTSSTLGVKNMAPIDSEVSEMRIESEVKYY